MDKTDDKQETPRTDAQEFLYDETGVPIVPVNFARQLERELAIAQDDLQAQCKAWWEAASPYATPKALREALSARGESRGTCPKCGTVLVLRQTETHDIGEKRGS